MNTPGFLLLAGIRLACLILMASAVGMAQSTAPAAILYQGKLTDANGTPAADGIGYEVEIRLWSSSTGGATPLWGARYTGVPVKNGAFGVILGAPGAAAITPATTTDLKQAFASTNVFLGLTVTKNASGSAVASPTEVLPRQQLLSVPFAMRGDFADFSTASAALKPSAGATVNAVTVAADGSVAIGKATPTATLDVNGTVKAVSFVGDGAQLTGIPIRTPSNNGTTYSSDTVYQNNTGFKLIVVWFGASRMSGGWGFIKQRAYIGASNPPQTQVASISFQVAASPIIEQSAMFVVPPGYYWRVTNEQWGGPDQYGNVTRIEAWQTL